MNFVKNELTIIVIIKLVASDIFFCVPLLLLFFLFKTMVMSSIETFLSCSCKDDYFSSSI